MISFAHKIAILKSNKFTRSSHSPFSLSIVSSTLKSDSSPSYLSSELFEMGSVFHFQPCRGELS